MKVNNVEDFIGGLKDFYFCVLEDEFPDITREELERISDERNK